MDASEVYARITQVKENAELLYDKQQVEHALDEMAAAVSETLERSNPLILCVLLGGLVPTAKLMSRLSFPCELSYVHTTRYRQEQDGDLVWAVTPYGDVVDRTVLIVDDILHHGTTLVEIEKALHAAGAAAVYKAVLARKRLPEQVQRARADFVGLEVPDRYIFGYGMSYKGYWRNLTGIYATLQN